MNGQRSVPLECLAAKAKAFATLHAHQPTTPFITNVDAAIDEIRIGDLAMPVTINQANDHNGHDDNDNEHCNSWVVSPQTTYSSYALEECERMVPALLRPPLRGLIGMADGLLRRANLDRAVSINNWLVSTNLYPAASAVDAGRLVRSCTERWPAHSLWFRSLNGTQHPDWITTLQAAGFALIPTRQVYLYTELQHNRHQNLRRDLALLHKTGLARVAHEDFTDADFQRCEQLYALLYLDKYSKLNPRYTARFMQQWHRAGLLRFTGFRLGAGPLMAVVGAFAQGPVSTAPVVGYDTSLPRELGLYRLLMAQVLEDSMERGHVLNLSAGAASFKRLRGGVPAIEYSAVYSNHLPARTQRALCMLRVLTTRFGVPLMRHFKL